MGSNKRELKVKLVSMKIEHILSSDDKSFEIEGSNVSNKKGMSISKVFSDHSQKYH